MPVYHESLKIRSKRRCLRMFCGIDSPATVRAATRPATAILNPARRRGNILRGPQSQTTHRVSAPMSLPDADQETIAAFQAGKAAAHPATAAKAAV
jgi:hypothetical protein